MYHDVPINRINILYDTYFLHKTSRFREKVTPGVYLSTLSVFQYTREVHWVQTDDTQIWASARDSAVLPNAFLRARGIPWDYFCIWRHQAVKQFLLVRVTNWAQLTFIIALKPATLLSLFLPLALSLCLLLFLNFSLSSFSFSFCLPLVFFHLMNLSYCS
jgi:hypothetical protein